MSIERCILLKTDQHHEPGTLAKRQSGTGNDVFLLNSEPHIMYHKSTAVEFIKSCYVTTLQLAMWHLAKALVALLIHMICVQKVAKRAVVGAKVQRKQAWKSQDQAILQQYE